MMWRAFFLAIGLFMAILGGQCLGVQKFTLRIDEDPVVQKGGLLDDIQVTPGAKKVIIPPPWVPWSLMSTGAVVCLYSFTLPRRWNG
jgi:hypothetical protein